jgi:SAM-dependent methyltransferase
MPEAGQSSQLPRENSPWLSQFEELLAPGLRVLDLGCGAGRDTVELLRRGLFLRQALHLRVGALHTLPAVGVRRSGAHDIHGHIAGRNPTGHTLAERDDRAVDGV